MRSGVILRPAETQTGHTKAAAGSTLTSSILAFNVGAAMMGAMRGTVLDARVLSGREASSSRSAATDFSPAEKTPWMDSHASATTCP